MEAVPQRWSLSATYTVELKVSDAPDTRPWLGGQSIRPHTVRIGWDYPPGDLTSPRASVYGHNVLKDGGLGMERRLSFYLSFEQWPEWLRQLVHDHAPDWADMVKGTEV